ncbi:MAG TPA: hypothetical protein VF062_29500 [Candidatus Limnocylindrales bacterium]
MTSTLTTPPVAPTGVRQQVATLRQDVIGALFGLALIGGLFADAWAHTNILNTIESFFTPWHALLYGGFAGTAAWTWWLAFRHRKDDPRWWRNKWPAGYALGALGSLIFLVAGAADMFWHSIFGVETSLKITLSPSHILLSIGGVLLLTSQMRSWWASGEGGWRSVTGVASAAFGTTFGLLLVTGLTGLVTTAATREFVPVPGGGSSTTPAAQGIQAYLLGAAVLLIPVLLVHRRRGTPGAITGIAGAVALFAMLQREFPMPLTAALIGVIVGAAVADVILWRLDVARGPQAPLRLPIAGAIFAASIWTGHLTGLALGDAVRWPPELWAGTVVMSALLGALLGTLAAGAGKPAQQTVATQ